MVKFLDLPLRSAVFSANQRQNALVSIRALIREISDKLILLLVLLVACAGADAALGLDLDGAAGEQGA